MYRREICAGDLQWEMRLGGICMYGGKFELLGLHLSGVIFRGTVR